MVAGLFDFLSSTSLKFQKSIFSNSSFLFLFCLAIPTGGSLSGELVTDEELFIRWLEIAAFLPVITFHTPPWVCGEDRVQKHTKQLTDADR